MIHKLFLPLMLGTALFAQTPDLKAVLNLSDDQIQKLVQLQQQKAHALEPLVQQVQQRQQKLQQLLADNPDPAAVGQLIIEITVIGNQIQKASANVQQQALNILQPDQRSKVESLSEVLKLQLAAQQAVSLGLLNAPN